MRDLVGEALTGGKLSGAELADLLHRQAVVEIGRYLAESDPQFLPRSPAIARMIAGLEALEYDEEIQRGR